MFAGLILFMLIGYPAAFSLAAVGLFFGFIGIELGLIATGLSRQPHLSARSASSATTCCWPFPFFTLMGTILERCGLAEDLLEGFGQLFGGRARRSFLCGHLRRRDPRRHHRHGRRLGDRHGAHLAADDDEIRLQRPPCHRRHRRLRHHHPAHPALAGARHSRRPAAEAGGRHVPRRHRRQRRPGAAVLRSGC